MYCAIMQDCNLMAAWLTQAPVAACAHKLFKPYPRGDIPWLCVKPPNVVWLDMLAWGGFTVPTPHSNLVEHDVFHAHKPP